MNPMKHVRESLIDFYNKKYFDALHYRMFEAEEGKDEKANLQDKEKDALDIIKKVTDDFNKFKSAAKGEISQFKTFWQENQQTKELFTETGNVYKLHGSDYVVAVLDLPTEVLTDGSIEGGLGAFQEEEEIIEGKPQEEITIEGDNGGLAGPDMSGAGDNLAEAEGEEEDMDLDLDKPAEETNPEEMPSDMPAEELPQEPDASDELMPDEEPSPEEPPMEEPPMEEPTTQGEPQTYLVVYDMSGGEREEIFRNGSTNAVKAFRDFYENTFKGTMKQVIQEYKEKKQLEKKEAETKEKERKASEKSGKLQKFLGK